MRFVKEDDKNDILNFERDYYRKKPLEVKTIDEGCILPQKKSTSPTKWMGLGGVLDKEGDFVELSGIKSLYEDSLVFGGLYEYDKEDVIYCNENVV